ncbi:MAG: nucleotide pyrophosphohydrolase [Gemmatimonadota bacterium]
MNTDAISELQLQLRDFARERDWQRYHTPQNLAALIASEAGELLALFRWGQDSLRESPDRVAQELADVCLGVLRFADVAGIDLEQACRDKIASNARRYPAGSTIGPDPL